MSNNNFSASTSALIEYVSFLADLKKDEFASTSEYGSATTILDARVTSLSRNPILSKIKRDKCLEWEKTALTEAKILKTFLSQKTDDDVLPLQFLIQCVSNVEGCVSVKRKRKRKRKSFVCKK